MALRDLQPSGCCCKRLLIAVDGRLHQLYAEEEVLATAGDGGGGGGGGGGGIQSGNR